MKELISVIIPVYNGKTYLQETVGHILNSSYKNLEILLIDDGSTDGSAVVCDYIAKKNSKVSVYHKKNGGIADARNYGIKKARGKYLCFCDQDDIIKPDAYKIMYEAMNADDSDVCITEDGFYRDGKVEKRYSVLQDGLFKEDDIVSKFFFPLVLRIPCKAEDKGIDGKAHLGAGMFRSKFIKDNNIFFKRFVDYEDDLLFVVDCYSKCKNLTAISRITYLWRVHSNSESNHGKYLTEYFERSIRFEKYIDSVIREEKIDDRLYKKNKWIRKAYLIYETFDNECKLSNPKTQKETIQYLNSIVSKSFVKQILAYSIKNSFIEKRYRFVGKLALKGYTGLAYYVNVIFLRYFYNLWVKISGLKRKENEND